MSTDQMEETMATLPVKEHEWLKNLLGEWRCAIEMSMGPGKPTQRSTGTENAKSLGGLWAFAEQKGSMPDGNTMTGYFAVGYDVSFKEYWATWIASVSSHLWKYKGELSPDGRIMTLNCEGPSMTKDGETARYREVIELIDADHRRTTSYGQDDDGNWQVFMTNDYTRV